MRHTPRLIAVTGATGFTGPFVLQALRTTFPSAILRAVVRPTSDRGRIPIAGVDLAIADLRDEPALRRAFAGADTLVNVASLGFDWAESVVRSAEDAGVQRGIFIGTTAILTTLPVASKLARERGEQLVRDSALAWTILRPTMIYGTSGDRNIWRLLRFVRRSPIVPVVAPSALQQPVHVEDVAAAVSQALASAATIGRTYNLSGERPLTLIDLINDVVLALGRRRLVVSVPIRVVESALSLWRIVGTPPIKLEQLHRIAEHKNFDHADAARDFGFRPRSFHDGVRAELRLLRRS